MADQNQYIEALFLLDLAGKAGAKMDIIQRDIASVYLLMNRKDYAIAHNRLALQENPNLVGALNNLSWILATQTNSPPQNIKEAVTLAERAVKLSGGQDSQLLDTLAVCEAADGNFSAALATENKAILRAETAGETNILPKLKRRILLFEQRQNVRE
jgi:tetratricopeptide (TPR) repeat protein